MLAIAGGTLGVLLAVWGTNLMVKALPVGLDLPRTGEIGVDVRILGITFVATILIAVAVGLVPLFGSLRSAPLSGLQTSARGASTSMQGRRGVSALLVVSEVALAFVLLAGAGLLVRSFRALNLVDPGFRAEHVVTMRTTLPASRILQNRRSHSDIQHRASGARWQSARCPLRRRCRLLTDESDWSGRRFRHRRPSSGDWYGAAELVDQCRRRRLFQRDGYSTSSGPHPGGADTEKTGLVLVIDEKLAQRYWPGEDPIGARVRWNRRDEEVSGEIVGVVGSVRFGGLAWSPPAITYFWFPRARIDSRRLSCARSRIRTRSRPRLPPRSEL